jgi:hypothetical protein
MSIEPVDAVTMAQSNGPSNPAERYLASLVEGGPARYIDNAKVRIEAVRIDAKLIPLVISEKSVAGNSNICSAYSHYVEYAFHELAERHRSVPVALLKAPESMLGTLLRSGSIDRTVFVNNWLFTTNPRHGLSAAQIADLTAYLAQRFPDSAIVFRSVNPVSDEPGLDALRTNRYRLIPSRRVYLLDAANQVYLEHRDARRDLGFLRRTQYSILDSPAAIVPHTERMAALYRDLYFTKHSPLNPQYNANFFARTLEDGFPTYRAFVQDGRIDAFVSYFIESELMTAALLAYDLSRPQKLGLYRLAFAFLIEEAAKRKVLLNMSAGAGGFKRFRGGRLVQECDAVYDLHLPWSRRLPWAALNLITRLGSLVK